MCQLRRASRWALVFVCQFSEPTCFHRNHLFFIHQFKPAGVFKEALWSPLKQTYLTNLTGCVIRKAEYQRIDTFELWCWRRLLRILWTAKRSNQSTQRRSILNIHWKGCCWNWRSNTLVTWCENWLIGKDPNARKVWGQKEKGTTEDEMDGITASTDLSLSKLCEIVMDREAWRVPVHGVTKS